MRNRTIKKFAFAFLLVAMSSSLSAQATEPTSSSASKSAQVSALIKKGVNQAKEKDYHQAINSFNDALALDPNSFDVYVNRGWTFRQIGDFKGAIEDYTKAIKIQSTKPQVYLNRGWCHKRLNQFDEALQDFNKALELDPKYLNAYRNRGSLKLKMGDYAGSVADFNQLMFLDPNAKAEVAKYVPKDMMDKVNKLDPKTAEKIGSQVAAAFSGSQIEISDADLAKLNNRAARAIKSGEFESAIKILEDIAKKKPNYKYAKENLATAYNNQGLKFAGTSPEQSAEQFRKAMFYSQQQSTTRTNLNAMLKTMGKDPESAQVRIALGDQLKAQRDYRGAFVEYMEALRLKNGEEARGRVAEVCALIDTEKGEDGSSPVVVASNPSQATDANPNATENEPPAKPKIQPEPGRIEYTEGDPAGNAEEPMTLPPVDLDTADSANSSGRPKPAKPFVEAEATALDLNPPPKTPVGQDLETLRLKWKTHIAKGDELFDQGNYVDSEAEYKLSLLTAKKLGNNNMELIGSLERISRIFLVQKRPVEALALLEQAYNLRKELQADPDPMHMERLGQKVLALRKMLYPHQDPKKKDANEDEEEDDEPEEKISTDTEKTASADDDEDAPAKPEGPNVDVDQGKRKLTKLFKRKKTEYEKDMDKFETTEKPGSFDTRPSWAEFNK